MVVRTWNGNRLLWRALAASVALHLLLALFLPVWTAQVSAGLQPIEAISFAHVARVEIQRPAAASLPAAAPSTAHRAPVVSFSRHKAELTAHTRKPVARVHAHSGPTGKHAAAPKLIAPHAAPLYARPAVTAQISTQQAQAAPSPQPAVTQGTHPVNSTGASDRGGSLPFGAAQPATLDPLVLAELQKRFAVHVTLVVTVGDDGHTKGIVFQPPLDPQTERAIRALLADANWDAAVCGGGVTCQATATIRL